MACFNFSGRIIYGLPLTSLIWSTGDQSSIGLPVSHIPIGNKSEWHKRSMVNGVLYITKTGVQWEYLPHDYPPHGTVWSFFRRARESGLWERITDALVKKARVKVGRKESPTYLFIEKHQLTLGELENMAAQKPKTLVNIKSEIESVDAQLQQISTLQRHIGAYGKTKEAYKQYKQSKTPEQFRAENSKVISDHVI